MLSVIFGLYCNSNKLVIQSGSKSFMRRFVNAIGQHAWSIQSKMNYN